MGFKKKPVREMSKRELRILMCDLKEGRIKPRSLHEKLEDELRDVLGKPKKARPDTVEAYKEDLFKRKPLETTDRKDEGRTTPSEETKPKRVRPPRRTAQRKPLETNTPEAVDLVEESGN